MSRDDRAKPDVREIVGRALLSTHLETPEHGFGAVHRIAALSKASRLGSAEWRLKLAHDRSSWEPAIAWLEARLEENLKLPARKAGQWRVRRCCEQAMREWLSAPCTACNGYGEIILRRLVKKRCQSCNGSGERSFTVEERARAVGSSTKALERGPMLRWIEKAGRILRQTDRATARIVSSELGLRQAA